MLDRVRLARHLEGFPHRTITRDDLRPAAVLVPLFEQDDTDHLLFTVRTGHLEHHGGEISFPGGRRDADDADLCATALRETEEELGIPRDQITVLGRLDDFYSVHGYHVVPFVGVLPQAPALTPDPQEIAEVFDAPLEHFRAPGIHHVEDWTHRGRSIEVDFYRYDPHVIWGLTAAILRQFLAETSSLMERTP